ncbi:type III-A CRISPR-associated RAMP protein Csm3 [Malaciobacter molluscorum LMG 25693]|uniref:CRISPR system Cms endoribonuclease Csm3 n=1 Tax=Malaciobacter molluscorum LMG 25693 TaxID=870501 RepID=A0A2G1DJ47_9BACT|nr:type III-A CRISPR-associated RAMP protein Csm3 [Malaciobacter molluscorum]AXX91682.1 CRISPR/Cas system-associated RAMP protein Csm3, type III-A [Malaciobacter molluscorum LMG 25693]PHO18522.1 type III-A CRISPR-associated RAMP protein Csm3 [Malaciobacter molluscorum LMG 25693]
MKYNLKVLTGLHIGTSDDTMNIGGIDSAVIKREIYADKTTGKICFDSYEKENIKKLSEPYIPGSSLKGKIRSLLEWKFGFYDLLYKDYKEKRKILEEFLKSKNWQYKIEDLEKTFKNDEDKKLQKEIKESNEYKSYDEINTLKDKPISSDTIKYLDNFKAFETKLAKLIIKLFGESAGTNSNEEIKITRAVFRDCYITNRTRKLFLEDKIKLKEEKAENSINRVDIGANPRFIERVPSGVEFDFEVIIRNFANDNNELLKNTIKLGLLLLQNDALGGGGSRGNGRIEFNGLKEEDIEKTFKSIKEKLGIEKEGKEGK